MIFSRNDAHSGKLPPVFVIHRKQSSLDVCMQRAAQSSFSCSKNEFLENLELEKILLMLKFHPAVRLHKDIV